MTRRRVIVDTGAKSEGAKNEAYDQFAIVHAQRSPSLLVRQLKEFNAEHVDEEIDYRSLGDSPSVGAALNVRSAIWRGHPVRRFDDHARMTSVAVPARSVPIADSFDVRWPLEDMFAKTTGLYARGGTS